MIALSIRRKIMGIAVALIVLMAVTSVMTVVLVMQVGERIEELTYSYVPAYGDLAPTSVRWSGRWRYAGSSSKNSGRRTTPASTPRCATGTTRWAGRSNWKSWPRAR